MKQQKNHSKTFILDTREISAFYGIDVVASIAYGIEANSLVHENGEFTQEVLKILHFTARRSFEFSSIFLLPELQTILRSKV